MGATAYSVGVYRAGETAVTAEPRNYRHDASRRPVLCSHGAGQTAATFFAEPWYVTSFTDYGYPWLGCDFGASTYSGKPWGNDDSITAVGAAITNLLGASGLNAKTDKLCLMGFSMGALTVLNWARQHSTQVLAVALIVPVLDLNDIYVNNKGGYQASIGTAYGVTYPTVIPGLATHSPVSYGSSDLAGVPITVWASDNDPTASTTAVCQAWGGAGATVTVNSLGAVGHSDGGLDIRNLTRFFDSIGGRL